MEDDLNFSANGRQPQFFSGNGRQPQFSGKWKMTSIQFSTLLDMSLAQLSPSLFLFPIGLSGFNHVM
jgi:hypothetical protein